MKRLIPTLTLPGAAVLLAACATTVDPGADTGADPVTATVTVTAAPETTTRPQTPPDSASATTTPVQVSPTLEDPPESSSSPTQPPAECTADALARDIDPALDSVLYCDGQWLRGGKWQTDWVVYAHWEGGRWHPYDPHGTTEMTGYPCHDLAQARADGAPAEILDMMTPCG